jgi:hypothetical protein
MKARPRGVENKIAEHLSAFFASRNWAPVERIPILGRTGPDITINESKLVIDVKSRIEVPKSAIAASGAITDYGNGLIGCRLDQIAFLFDEVYPIRFRARPTKVVMDWWKHMDEWTQENCPGNVSALVLHRPGNGTHNTTVVIHSQQRSILWQDVLSQN